MRALDEDLEQLGVELTALDLGAHDVERLLGRHRLLVRAVARGQRVEDVRDRHHPRRDRDLSPLSRFG